MPTILERFRRSWNAFKGRDPTYEDQGYGSSYRLDRNTYRINSARSIVGMVYNRIAVDVSQIEFRHVRLNEDGFYQESIYSPLNTILTCEANIDQTGRAFIQDAVTSMFDEGHVVLVPTFADLNLTKTQVQEAKVYNARVGKVVTWYPQSVVVNVYNDITGRRQDILLPKSLVSIVENPFYSIMNEPNSTLQRLLKTISILDRANDQNTAGKLDMIIQLPYVIKSETRRAQAEQRRQDIEDQLTNSKYGVAYTDGTEKIIQLNRSLENNLWDQVKTLTTELYNQLGLTDAIFNGTADEQAMINYNNRTLEPICSALCNEMERKFLTPTARTQKQAIRFFRDPFKLAPASQIADMADKFTTAEILSSNEIRGKLGMKPSSDPKADELVNGHLNQTPEQIAALRGETPEAEEPTEEMGDVTANEPAQGNSDDVNNMSFDDFEKFLKNGAGRNQEDDQNG